MQFLKLLAISGLFAVGAATAAQAGLISNGDFETGDFTGWTVTDQAGGSGTWFVQATGAGTSINGFGTPTLATGGSFFASTDQSGQGSHTLSQTFAGVAGGTYTLDFDGYVNSQGGGPFGTGLDFNTQPNQHVEVDVNGTVIYSGLLTTDWASYSFDISSAVLTGVNTLSFGEVDNQLFLNEGLDNISLTGVVSAPEPLTLSLFGAGLAGATVLRRRKKVS